MNCENPDCHNVIPEDGGITVNTRFCWDQPRRTFVVCSVDCVEPATEAGQK